MNEHIHDLLDQQKTNDPAEQQREVQATLAGDQPFMSEGLDPWTLLPRGRKVGDRWDTKVSVKELTGSDEEALAKYRKDPTLLMDAVITHGIETIGPENLTALPIDERQTILRDLLIGEREQLFLAVSRVTFGDEKELSYQCNTCGETSDLTISLQDNITFRKMKDPQADTYRFVTSKGNIVEYRLVTGNDQFALTGRTTGLSDSEQNTLLFTEIIVSVDGRPPVDKRQFVLDLGMKDRAKLLKDVIENQPSPDLMMKTQCPSCESEVLLPLTWELVFRP